VLRGCRVSPKGMPTRSWHQARRQVAIIDLVEVRVITPQGVQQHSIQELPDLLARGALVWVDIPAVDTAAEQVLTEVFQLHPMAIADLGERNRVPKMHAYADHVLVVLHAPERGAHGHVHYVELDQVVGRNYLITVHGPVNPAVAPEAMMRETDVMLARLQAGRLQPTIGFELSDAIVSALTRSQEDYIEMATIDVWRLEKEVTGGQIEKPAQLLTELFEARHGLLAVRTMAALSGTLYDRIAALPKISDGARPLAADLADKFERVRAVADGEREYLQGVIEFYQTTLTVKATLAMQTQNETIQQLTEASFAQNEQVKRISAWAAIFFAPTLVGTVYGMNFEHIPELHWLFGYPLALLIMVLASVALYLVFRRQRWL
jgi:magnesium transporter